MRSILLFLTALLSAVTLTAEEIDDVAIIHTRDGKSLRVQSIERDDCYLISGVVAAKRTFRIPACNVASVHYISNPFHELAIEKRDEEKNRRAATYFKKALETLPGHPAFDECTFGLADALMEEGFHSGCVSQRGVTKYPVPTDCFEQILKRKPESRYRLEIAMKLPLGLAHQGRFDAAHSALETSRTWLKEYKVKGLAIDPEFYESSNQAVARLALVSAQVARLEAAAGRIPESEVAEAARQACSATLKYGALRAEAFDERLGSLLRLKDYAAARAEAESLLSEIDTKKESGLSAARGTAYFTIGQCNLEAGLAMQKSGQALQANQQFAEARWNFLNVVAGSIELDRHIPGAHYFAAQCSELLARIEPNGIRDAGARRRLLIDRFPETSFAKLAQAQIVK